MKRRLSIILIVALVLSIGMPAFAASSESASLEKAIQKAKSVVDIPKAATEFEYNAWDDPEYGTVWNLNWSDKNYTTSVHVSIDASGTIINYYYYDNEDKKAMGTVSREQGQKNAESFLAKALPNEVSDIQLNSSRTYDNTHSYTYDYCPNGVPVKNSSFSLEVDKHTGKVVNYYGYNVITNGKGQFPDTAGSIDREEAIKAYLENSGLSLIYQSYYDWESRNLIVFPAYTLDSGIYIDAKTGEIAKEYRSDYYPRYATADAGGSGAANLEKAQELTPAERDAVDNVTGLMSKDDALKAALAKLPQKPSKSAPTGFNLSNSYEEKDKYIWYFSFEDMSVSVNAKTGELISYYLYTALDSKGSAISREKAEKTAFDYIKRVAPEKSELVLLSEPMSSTQPPMPLSEKDGYREPYVFVYARQVDGIGFPGNSISVSVDATGGKITQYSLRWYDSLTFEPVDEAISAERAFEVFDEKDAFDLMYIKTGEKENALVYGFYNVPAFFVDPLTAEKTGYDGKSYREDPNVQSYGDIDGKWYADTVNKLLDNGYYIEGENFNGGAQITQEEFLRYLYSPIQSGYSQEQFYDMLIQNKVIEKSEKAPDSLLSRQGAAKLSIRYLGLDKAAKDGSIFKNMFTDPIAQEYMGYAALSKSLSIMNGDAKGNFNGTKVLTRGEAAVIVYNTLENR